MPKTITFDQALQFGFNFPGARAWIEKGNRNQLARDAALITTPNTTVPVEFLAYIDPQVVEVMTAPRRAREIFELFKMGTFETAYAKWPVEELTGRTQPYSDFAAGGVSDVNYNWPLREQYRFETTIQVGDLETAMASGAKIDLMARKQVAASTILEIDGNSFYLRGVQGREIYGILNDPNLPASITPTTGAAGLTWDVKTTREIYNDVLALFQRLVDQSAGLIPREADLRLELSPGMEVELGKATDFNVSALDMVKKYFPNLKVVALPELASPTAGETMMMIAESVAGQKTGYNGFSELIRAGRVIPQLSAMIQKWVSTTYGGIVRLPFAIATMQGI